MVLQHFSFRHAPFSLTGLAAALAVIPAHAAEAPFRAGAAPPDGAIELILDALSATGNFSGHIERTSLVWNGRVVDFWILITLQLDLSAVELGVWRQMRIDCDARARMAGSEFPLDKSGNLMGEDTLARRPMEPVNPGTMDEFLVEALCDGRSFALDPAVMTDVMSAAVQGHAELERAFP